MPNQTDLATENARLRLLLAQTVDDVEAARESPRVPQTPDPHISEERMRQWCDELMQIFDDEQAAIDGLMLLLWNVTHQKDHLDCIDLADRLIEHLYGQTVDCGNQCRNYLQTLPEKNYQQDAKAPPQTLAANA